MYATWKNYQLITNYGIRKEVLIYEEPGWGGGTQILRYAHTSSPAKLETKRTTCYYANNGNDCMAYPNPFGARPTLYQEGITE